MEGVRRMCTQVAIFDHRWSGILRIEKVSVFDRPAAPEIASLLPWHPSRGAGHLLRRYTEAVAP